ncbi:MAG TPA: hypothetical protein VJ183_02545 [Chloroflexia bacterium]|nr:hypothetical protein [Chloroflexia bacterium]
MDYTEGDIETEALPGQRTTQEGISKIFYFFERYTTLSSGRTIGRKIGVVQEIVVRSYLLQYGRLADAVIFEPQLPGYSGATHKVEFVFCQPIKVVEFGLGCSSPIGSCQFTLLSIDTEKMRATFSVTNGEREQKATLIPFQVLDSAKGNKGKGVLSFGATVKISTLTDDRVRLVVLDRADVRASVESKRVGAQRFSGSDKLGAGIQTIEKAKQASLVAIDADLLFNGQLKVLSVPGATRRYISVVVLGNGVHWTEKDLSVLKTYVDFTFLIPDDSIIRYAEHVLQLATEAGHPFIDFFQSYFEGMTKAVPDGFTVGEGDFQVLRPETETRTLSDILDSQLDTYPIVEA